MSHATEPTARDWTAADLVERFGPIPLCRVRGRPAPGAATEQDVIELVDHKDKLCELVDGVLLEKTVGIYESYLAALLSSMLQNFVRKNGLGIVLGADGMIRLAPGLVRIPDVSFIAIHRLPGREVPREAMIDLAPDLAVEVVSKNNTREEMDRKLRDYFAAGVRLVWCVYPERREVWVFAAPEEHTVLAEDQTLDGGAVLPGFVLELRTLFAKP